MASPHDTQQIQVYDALRTMILDSELEPKERISERALCQKLGATRGPVRESLIRLEGEGLVRKTPSHAYYVEDFTRQDKEDVYAVRFGLERIAVRKAVENGTLDDKVALAVICEEEQRAFAAGDEETRVQCDQMFHQRLLRASGSRVLQRVFEMVTLPVLSADVFVRQRIQRTVSEHAAICTAIRDGDAGEAERLICQHLEPGLRFDTNDDELNG
ncbi:MAG: GntR family transcriptional regulator [Victivallales bacterium]|nr:GntR family transcriptional regulator [Victivallales bacterium]